MSNPAEMHPLLKQTDVCRLLGVSRTTLYALMNSDEALAPLRLGRCLRWRAEDITAYIDNLPKRAANDG